MMKITGLINVKIHALTRPTLMHDELCFLHMAHTCPDNRQSSHSNFTATGTWYIWVTQILKLRMEVTFPYKGHTSRPSFL